MSANGETAWEPEEPIGGMEFLRSTAPKDATARALEGAQSKE